MDETVKAKDVHAVFNGQTITVWVGEGPILLTLSRKSAKELTKLLLAALEEAQ